VTTSCLDLTRSQILAFRRYVGALESRLPHGAPSLERAAWAGLQDSMPRAALMSIHARVDGIEPSALEDPSLVQLWGPRYSVFVVGARDVAVFTLGTMPDDAQGRHRAEDLAQRIHAYVGSAPVSYAEVGRALGVHRTPSPGGLASAHRPDAQPSKHSRPRWRRCERPWATAGSF
jgi:hypothetical protein